jgi:hypothetical protein
MMDILPAPETSTKVFPYHSYYGPATVEDSESVDESVTSVYVLTL